MKIFIAVAVAVIIFIVGLAYVWDWMLDEPEQVKRKPGPDNRAGNPQRKERGRKIPAPDEKPKTDKGMNPQERTLPHTRPKKPEPIKEKKMTFKFQQKRPSLTPDWKKQEQKDRDKGR